MDRLQQLNETLGWLWPVVVILVIWDTILKLVAMWKSARSNQLAWFICIGIINTAGVLPIVYLLTHRKKSDGATP